MIGNDQPVEPSSVWRHDGHNTVTFFGKTARQTKRTWKLPNGRHEDHYPAAAFFRELAQQHTVPFDHMAVSLEALFELFFDTQGRIMERAKYYRNRIEVFMELADGRILQLIAYAKGLPEQVDVMFCDEAGSELPVDDSAIFVFDPTKLGKAS